MRKIFFFCGMLMMVDSTAFSSTIFTITKSSNHNQVVYDLNDKEVTTYWRMNETDGHIEELTGYERHHVYGADVTGTDHSFQISVKALPAYPITVQLTDTISPVGTMRLLGRDRIVHTVHLQLSGGLIPGVKWIEVVCQNTSTETETIVLKEVDGGWTEKLKD